MALDMAMALDIAMAPHLAPLRLHFPIAAADAWVCVFWGPGFKPDLRSVSWFIFITKCFFLSLRSLPVFSMPILEKKKTIVGATSIVAFGLDSYHQVSDCPARFRTGV